MIAVTLSTAAAVLWGNQYPWLHGVAALVAWLVGKLLGVPIDSVVAAALTAMGSDKAIKLAVTSVNSMPPNKSAIKDEITRDVLERITAHAVASMPPDQAAAIARGLLEQVPAVDRGRVLERIVFLQSQRPPPVLIVPTTAPSSGEPVSVASIESTIVEEDATPVVTK